MQSCASMSISIQLTLNIDIMKYTSRITATSQNIGTLPPGERQVHPPSPSPTLPNTELLTLASDWHNPSHYPTSLTLRDVHGGIDTYEVFI